MATANATSAHDFTAVDIDGQQRDLSEYAGKVMLVVNVASKCGFTPQYTGLEKLWTDYKERDLRVATPSARFGFTERRFGVPLIDGGTQRLPRVIGTGRALDLVLTGRTVDATEAHQLGLVTELVQPGEHVTRAVALANEIAAHPRETTNSDRRALLAGETLPLTEGLALEARLGRESLRAAHDGARRFTQRK